MRGTERPGKIKWSRPFLAPLKPLSEFEAHQTFADIAEGFHDDDQVKTLLSLTGNLPLAVSLMASVASYESCDTILARWKTESTDLLSDGYDTRSSLNISIKLSFESPRMTTDAQNLLSLLSMLPDGVSDAELIQSQLPISNVLSAKMTLIQTSLAYIDNTRRIKVLVPIREFITRIVPPSDAMKFAFRQHIHTMLDLQTNVTNTGSPVFIAKASSNLGNISSILSDSLGRECPDVIKNIRSTVLLNSLSRMTNRGPSPLMLDVEKIIGDLKDDYIYRFYLVEVLYSAQFSPISNVDEKINYGNHIFETAPEGERGKTSINVQDSGSDGFTAEWYYALGLYYQDIVNDPRKALEYQKAVLSLNNIQNFERIGHSWRLIANSMSMSGNHLDARVNSQKAQEYLELGNDMHGQAQAILIESRCCYSLGDFAQAGFLCSKAQKILEACGLQGGLTAETVKNHQAEIHLLKTEYIAAQSINISIMKSFAENPTPNSDRAYAHLNLALIGIAIRSDQDLVIANLDKARAEFNALPYPVGLLDCDMVSADLYLAQKNGPTARKILIGCLVALKNPADQTVMFCMERLADLGHGMDDCLTTLNWAVLYLGLALKTKNLLDTVKSLRCLGDIFVAEQDEETALTLFKIALDGFTFMDVHRCKADCMVRIAGILEHRGQTTMATELWKKARTPFQRSSQVEEVSRIDAKLSAAEFHAAEHSRDQLLQLKTLSPPSMPDAGLQRRSIEDDPELLQTYAHQPSL